MTISPLRLCDKDDVMRTSTKVLIRRGLPAKLTMRLLVRRRKFVNILFRGAFDQHALDAADHGLADNLRHFINALLQTAQAG